MKSLGQSTFSPPAQPETPIRRVAIFAGHMIDAADRPSPRFPAQNESRVRARLAEQLSAKSIGPGDLAISGVARGGDLLFAELCAECGAELWLFLPMPENEFLDESVRLPGTDWEARFHAIGKRPRVRRFFQHEQVEFDDDLTVHARNNLWMIETARRLAPSPDRLLGFMVWNGKTGDGPGGTVDFAERVQQLGGDLAPPIDPLFPATP
jgi:hypothetical protein